MISVIIPTLNAGATLGATLSSLLDANRRGLIREVIVSDGGSEDATLAIAEDAGARIIRGQKSRGGQLRRGANEARGDWMLFLHADTRLAADWPDIVQSHIAIAFGRVAGVFKLRFDAPGVKPLIVAAGANLRAGLWKLPYGDQGLLINRDHYDKLGGYNDLPMFEDVDIVRRITSDGGRRALKVLHAVATTSAERYRAEGYFVRVWRNFYCVRMYFHGVPPARIMEVYSGKPNRLRSALGGHGKTAIGRARED